MAEAVAGVFGSASAPPIHGLLEIERDGRIVFANAVYHRIMGCEPGSLVGRMVWELIPSLADRGQVLQILDHLLAQQPAPLPFSGQTEASDGRPLHYQATWDYRRDAEGRVTGFFVVVTDTTEQQRIATALRQSEQQHRLLADSIPLHIGAIDGSGKYVLWNRHSEAMFGYSADEVIGKMSPIMFYTGDGDPGRLFAQILAEVGGGGTFDRELDLRHRDGSTFPARVVIVARRDADGEINGFYGIAQDVSEQRRNCEEIERLAALRRALSRRALELQEQERLHLARELHDDLGQMLAVLKMEAQWIERNAARADQVVTGSRRLCQKVDEALGLVRNLAHGLRPAAIDDLGVGCAIETLAEDATCRSKIRCLARCAEGPRLPTEVATAVYRIAQEALANIVRHSGAANAWLTFATEGNTVELTVEDDGAGIRDEDTVDSRSLGIAGMRERAALLGGELTIGPRAPRGTALVARIPTGPGRAS